MSTAKIPVTAVIPVRNDDRNLEQCLASLDRFDEIVVVDSGENPATRAISESVGARYEPFTFKAPYPKKRNWVLETCPPRNDWVLFIDADERVTPAFADTLLSRLQNNPAEVGYWLRYQNYFLGKPLRFGLPQRKLALFRHSAGAYERIDDPGWSAYDMEVHEHPILTGPIGSITEELDHLDARSMTSFINKHVEYAKWEAGRTRELYAGKSDARLTLRQKVKYGLLLTPVFPIIYFLYTYVIRLGFLDGKAGFSYAVLKASYFAQIYLMTRDGAEQAGWRESKPQS